MIQVIDRQTGLRYDIEAGSKISILKTQPMLSEQGSISLPFTLQYTNNNLRILDCPQRFDRTKKYLAKREVIILANGYQLLASLVVTKITRNSSISATFLVDEGDVNNRVKDVTMTEVFRTIEKDPYEGMSTAEKVSKWAHFLDTVMGGYFPDEDFAVFPICTSYDKETGVGDFLNHVNCPTKNGLWYEQTYPGPNGNLYYTLFGINEHTVTVDDTTITYPVGYGITPFLKLKYVLKALFAYFGYNLQESLFDTDSDLRKIVVLNNTVDALMFGVLNYGQLVPSCTVEEFLNAVRYKFGCDFFVDEDGIRIRIVFWNDILKNIGSDRTKQQGMYPVNSYESQKTIKLTQQHNISTSDLPGFISEFSTWQDFQRVNKDIIVVKQEANIPVIKSANYFVTSVLMYCRSRPQRPGEGTGTRYMLEYIGQNLFDFYDESSKLESVEVECPDEAVPIIRASLPSRWKLSETNEKPDSPLLLMPYIGETRMLNTTIVYSSKEDSGSKANQECPIMFCYSHGRAAPDGYNSGVEKCSFGTTYGYDNAGNAIGELDLVFGGERGLYERFYKLYDRVLRHSFQPVQTKLNLPAFDMIKYDRTELDLIDGQPLLFESMKYEISDDGANMVEINYRTVRQYSD